MRRSDTNPGSKLLVTVFVLLAGDVYLFATKSYIGGIILSVVTACDLALLIAFVVIQNREYEKSQEKNEEDKEIICKNCGYILKETDLECPNCNEKTEEKNENS